MTVIRTGVPDLDELEELETVHTITDHYDGPVRGIANYRGRPHYYQRQFDDEADEWSEIYWQVAELMNVVGFQGVRRVDDRFFRPVLVGTRPVI